MRIFLFMLLFAGSAKCEAAHLVREAEADAGVYGEVIGIVNHNGGNIRAHSIKGWPGAVGLDPWLHIKFKTDLDGLKAIRKVLTAYDRKHHLTRLNAIVWRWVGPAKNEAQRKQKEGYLRAIVQHTGIGADGVVDLKDRNIQARLARAIVIGECGRDPYKWSLYQEAFSLKRGKHASAR
jgi:hypothetical protein